MSRTILWIGFVLAILMLMFGLISGGVFKYPLSVILYLAILIGSGYKLFIQK